MMEIKFNTEPISEGLPVSPLPPEIQGRIEDVEARFTAAYERVLEELKHDLG